MPRRKGPRKPKPVHYYLIPAEHPAYPLLRELVAAHHAHLAEAKIALAWRLGAKPDKDGRVVLGLCKKASDLDRELKDLDFVIVLNAEHWDKFSDAQRAALLDHELCHAQVELDEASGEPRTDARGRTVYRVRGHDLEEFREVVERHGLYKADLAAFARACAKQKKSPLFPDLD